MHNFEDILWLDETWVNAGHIVSKGWSDGTVAGSAKAPIGERWRLIVVHAGTSNLLLKNCLLVYWSKKTGDDHEEMETGDYHE